MSETSAKPSVLVAGSEVLCVRLLAEYLASAEETGRVVRAHSLSQAQERWTGNPPTIVFLEQDSCHARAPDLEPREWKLAFPDARVIAFAYSTDVMDAVRAIERGACGFVSKNAEPGVFVERVQQVMRGELAIAPEHRSVLMSRLRELSTASSDPRDADTLSDGRTDLTARELDVLKLLAEGMTNRRIADTLELSESTVKNHLTNLFRKLGVDCRSQAIVVGVRGGILRF